MIDLKFKDLSAPVRLIGCPDLLPLIHEILRDWPVEVCAGPVADAPGITVQREGDGTYRISAPWLSAPLAENTALCVVCSFIVDLAEAYFASNDQMLCMHGAAAEMAGKLVVFPNTWRAGKSTLMARLAAARIPVYADDILPVTPRGDGLSLGIAPRLRLPVPGGADSVLQRFVAAHRGPGDERYLYLHLDAPAHVPFGRTAPVGAFVLLDRRDAGPASLEPVGSAVGMRDLVRQNFIRQGDVVATFARLKALSGTRPCWRLVYADLDEAAALLQAAFAAADGWGFAPAPHIAGDAGAQPEAEEDDCAEDDGAEDDCAEDDGAGDISGDHIRHSAAVLEDMDGARFLISPDDDAIFQLNPSAALVWELLAEPVSLADVVETLGDVFPDILPAQIERDMSRLFHDLRACGLILAAPSGEV